MNGTLRQGMISQSTIGQPQTMLSIGNPPFSSMQTPIQLGAQQPLGPTSLGMPQNVPNNPPMTILGGGPIPGAVPRYPIPANAMHLQQQQRQMGPRPPQNLNPAVASPSTSHIQSQLQNIPFSSNVMPGSFVGSNVIRRAQSQPQININSLPGMPQQTMPGQLRQQNPHHLNQMRMQQQQHQQHQQMMPQSNLDNLMRNQVPGNPASMANRMGQTQSQVMSSLTQPPPLGSTSLPAGMPSVHQNNFNGQLSTSPRPNSTQGMPMGTPGLSHAPINRPRTSPDSSNAYMGYPASQFSGNATNRGIAPSPSPSSYPFVPATSPRIQLSDISQSSPPGMMPPQSGNPKTGFFPTPAQQHLDMTAEMYNSGFSMPPPSMPSQPSFVSTSMQQPSLPSPQTPALPNPQQQQQRPPQLSPSPQQQVHQHQIAHQIPADQIHGLSQSPRTQPQLLQSQGVGGTPGGAPSTPQAPRGIQPPTFAGGLTASGRHSQQNQGALPSQSTQQQALMTGSSRSSLSGSGAAMPPPPRAPSSGTVSTTSPPPGSGIEQANKGKSTGGSYRTSADNVSGPPSSSSNNQEKQGVGLMRLLQFSGTLSNETQEKHRLGYWDDLIREYFTPTAIMRLTLWKDNQRIEAKPFEIGVPILPRFFLVTTQSGVKSMNLSFDSARERIYQHGHLVIECLDASWTYRYRNGYIVTLRGPLTAHIIATSRSPPGSNNGDSNAIMYRFDELQFDANFHDKYIALESILGARSKENPQTPMMMTAPSPSVQASALGSGPSGQSQTNQQQADDERKWEEPRVLIDHASLPGEPVNAFGIPQATMRCLELAESVTSMAELIQFARGSHGPLDALKEFARRFCESGAVLPSHPPVQSLHNHPMHINHQFYQAPLSAASSGTLYSGSASPSTTHSMPPGSTPINAAIVSSPPNTTLSGVNSPEKQLPKTIPQHSQQVSAPTTSPSMSTASTPTAGSLKRKQTGDVSSPTIGNEPQPQKRVGRKRGRTGTG